MESLPSCSKLLEEINLRSPQQVCLPLLKREKRTYFTSNEKSIVLKVYKYVKDTWPANKYLYKTMLKKKVADIVGIGIASVHRILKEYATDKRVKSPTRTKKRPIFSEKIDDFDKGAIRKKVHSFYVKGEIPTLKKVLEAVNEDTNLPNFRRSTFQKILKHLKFKYVKRQGDNALIDRDDIALWRAHYLRTIQKYRSQNRPIFYLDETWVNTGHTVPKCNSESTVTSKHQACTEGLNAAAKNLTLKGQCLVVVHIGNEHGFVDGADDVFQYMDADCFEQWFEKQLPKLGENAIVVMDNATYHSRRVKKYTNTALEEPKIQEWLQNKICFDKRDIDQATKEDGAKNKYQSYAVDELAKQHKVEVLRLPPYHCELNPIELVWADIKEYVVKNNTTSKFQDVLKLVYDGIRNVSVDKWRNCVRHIINVEDNFYSKLDNLIDSTVIDNFVINMTNSDSEESCMSSTDFDD